MSRLAVVGHVEWVDFLSVAQLPELGQITPAERVRVNAAGGAVVAAAVLAELGAEVDFFGAFGSDPYGDRAIAELRARGITVHAVRRPGPSRQVITFVDAHRERSIVTIGERLAPRGADALDWERLAGADGVYFTAGDLGALRAARRARILVTTPRLAETLPSIDVELDALVFSSDDAAECRWAAALEARARLRVVTEGGSGGHWSERAGGGHRSERAGEGHPSHAAEGRWGTAPPPGPVIDSYGAGDSFAAGFTFGLATTGDPATAARIGAECGARALTHPGGP
jgi:ribokinase